MRRKRKYTEGPWSNENLSHKVGGRVGIRNRLKKRETHTEQMRWRTWQSQGQESQKERERERETGGRDRGTRYTEREKRKETKKQTNKKGE